MRAVRTSKCTTTEAVLYPFSGILILGDWKTVSAEGIPTNVNDVRLNALSTL